MIINKKNFSIYKEILSLKFLIQNISFRLFFKYIKSRIQEIFYLTNEVENKFLDFIKQKNFKYSKIWFLSNLNIFEKILKNNPKNILEVGTYEGLVSIWFCEKYPSSKVFAVDPLVQDLSTKKERVENEQVKNLQENLNNYNNKNLIFEKKTSDNYFLNNKIKFDIIYIDGLHTYDACSKDIINSFDCLNINGYLMIDDVRLNVYPKKLNVINAVMNFTTAYKNYIQVKFFGWNVIIIKKIRNAEF
tara:strand:+ start:541 stop:1278 length:738 start_codon:yes stop_codon:yes gene_type:complete